MTSNIGARQLKEFGQGVGFTTAAKTTQTDSHSRSVIETALKRAFAPEFLNRIDDVIVFNSLSKENIFKIIDIELRSLFGRITDLGYTIDLTVAAKEFIAEKGYDTNFGARPLKRAIQKYLEDPIAEEILKGDVKAGDRLKVDLNAETKEIEVTADRSERPIEPADKKED
ncbi:Chaperone protein ClpB [compost metagenome]